MPRLPVVSGRKMMKLIERLGWELVNSQGSHRTYQHPESKDEVHVIDHKELAHGTLSALIKSIGLSRDEFFRLYRKL